MCITVFHYVRIVATNSILAASELMFFSIFLIHYQQMLFLEGSYLMGCCGFKALLDPHFADDLQHKQVTLAPFCSLVLCIGKNFFWGIFSGENDFGHSIFLPALNVFSICLLCKKRLINKFILALQAPHAPLIITHCVQLLLAAEERQQNN